MLGFARPQSPASRHPLHVTRFTSPLPCHPCDPAMLSNLGVLFERQRYFNIVENPQEKLGNRISSDHGFALLKTSLAESQ